ncbi:MAG: 16S rRNA (cytosine(967)-C(5))-methyltransferase [Clostridiales bacterium 38-18]|nr:MAG: 16S rRNA (cytosine(967)-C(5))-methyltransferase [Clostridiales bacterium 38-18]
MKINARKLALRILDEISENREFSHIVLNRTFDSYEIESIDRRFISQIVLGVLENQIRLDYYIRKLSSLRFGRIDQSVINILRMGLYQLSDMDKIPESAAVNEAVKLAKAISPKYGGFVNGILRQFIRLNKQVELPNKNKHIVTYLSIAYSYPEWLISLWIDQYGISFTEALLVANHKIPELSLRVNTFKTDRETVIKNLENQGVIAISSEHLDEGIIIKSMNGNSVKQLNGYEAGDFIIQDLSSMAVASHTDVNNGNLIIDVCAAPGGKSTHFAQKLKNTGCVISRDLQEDKLEKIRDNFARLGLSNGRIESYDASILDESLVDQADIVVVDAPCSGLGIIRRKPDIKYNKTPEGLKELEVIQAKILDVSSKYVKPGGKLIYSTCTLNKGENEDIVDAFLRSNPSFVLEFTPETFFPNQHGSDGFFIARLIRRS